MILTFKMTNIGGTTQMHTGIVLLSKSNTLGYRSGRFAGNNVLVDFVTFQT